MMKKSIIVLLFLVQSLFFVQSCKVQEPPAPLPEVSVILPVTDTIIVGRDEVVKFKFKATTSAEDTHLLSYSMALSEGDRNGKFVKGKFFTLLSGAPIFSDKVSKLNTRTFEFEDSILTDSAAAHRNMLYLSFKIYNKIYGATSALFYIRIDTNMNNTILAYSKTKNVIFNLAANTGCPAGWDLAKNIQIDSNAVSTDTDMINTTENDSQSPNFGVFARGWKSLNGTAFVKADTNFNFQSVSLENIIKDFKSKPPKSEIQYCSEGEMYIARLRAQENYAILKITNISDDKMLQTSEIGTNCDYIKFDYRKLVE